MKVKLEGHENSILSDELATQIRFLLPDHLESLNWKLIYRLDEHGASLQTLFDRCGQWNTPCVLVMKDTSNVLHGAFASESLHRCANFYGNGDCFLFNSTNSSSLKAYLATELNENFILSATGASIAFGTAPDGFGLWVDDLLQNGHSSQSTTYRNQAMGSFQVADFEIWSVQ